MEQAATYKVFFALLKAGLWGCEPEYDSFPLTPKAWERVYVLARKQTVEGVVYDGMMRLPNDCLPPRELLLKWVVKVDTIEKSNERMNVAVGQLYEFFTKNHIKVILRKGQGAAACYDNPLLRVCGDIDWFFPDRESFSQAGKLMERNRVKINDHERLGECYMWRGIFVEHHRHILDIYNPFLSGYIERMLQQEYAHSTCLDIQGQNIVLPSPALMHLSVNTHILKHLLALGVSLRQLCDSARICYTYHNIIDGESLKEIYVKLGIYPWIQQLNRILVEDLGMSEKYLPFPLTAQKKANWMIKDILRGGFFGAYGGPFSKESDEPQSRRKYKSLNYLVLFCRYLRYAPWEALWFPVMHLYSDIRNLVGR